MPSRLRLVEECRGRLGLLDILIRGSPLRTADRNKFPVMSKGRTALAVILGLVLNMALGFASIALAWAIFGPERAFRGETTVASAAWSGFGCIAGLAVGAIVGRATSVFAGQSSHLPVVLLAGFLLASGLGVAILGLDLDPRPLPEGKSVADLTFFEAGELATSPAWYSFAAPCIVALGVLIGGSALPVGRR